MKSVRKLIGKPVFMPLQIANTWSHFYNECTNIFSKFDKFSAELHPIPVKDEVWHTIGVDLIGPLPETQKGNKYIMTVSCLFSKWPEATALPDKTATGVAEFLLLCFTRHGCCKVKISDQGREFVNQVNYKYNYVVMM